MPVDEDLSTHEPSDPSPRLSGRQLVVIICTAILATAGVLVAVVMITKSADSVGTVAP